MVIKKRNDLDFYDRVAREWWDEKATIYALSHLNLPRFQYFDRFVANWQGLKVLDLGCGGGFTCEFLARRGAFVSGIDRSKNCIQAAKKHADKNNLSIDYQNGIAENLPYPDNFFDAVICVDVLEHVSDLKKTIFEIYRVLKPGGFFGFDTINRTFQSRLIMLWILEDILQKIPRGIHDWNKFIKPEELRNIMDENGFKNIELKGFNIFGRSIFDNISSLFYYQKTGTFQINIDRDLSVMYIGKAIK